MLKVPEQFEKYFLKPDTPVLEFIAENLLRISGELLAIKPGKWFSTEVPTTDAACLLWSVHSELLTQLKPRGKEEARMGGQSGINTHKWEMSSYKILSLPKMIMHTVGSTDIQSTTCSARGKQYCWQDGSSRQKINLLCKISKSSYILLFDYGLWALPSNPVSQHVCV